MSRIVLKLGGSLVTRKDVKEFPLQVEEIKEKADEYIRYDVIRRVGKELKEAMDGRDLQFILVNGVGPFGHYLVEHKRPDEDVRESVKYLNKKIVSELRSMELDVVSIPPSESCKYVDGEFDISELWGSTQILAEKNKILSTYGDVLEGGKVISGDDLIILLAERWKADKIISVTDVDGVYTKNPKIYKDAQLIKKIGGLGKEGIKAEYVTDAVDVTGSMAYKVKKLREATKYGIKGQIINGMKEGNLKAALLGDENIGTLILP